MSAVVAGLSPYGTKRDLFFQFGGFEEAIDDGNEFIFARGHAAEEELRELLFDKLGLSMPEACFESLDGKLAASLDGYIKGGGIAEMKYIGKPVFDSIDEEGVGAIPAHHYIQMQKNMAVSNEKVCYYCLKSSKKDKMILEVPFNEEFAASIIESDYAFLADVEAGNIPPLSFSDTNFVSDIVAASWATEYLNLKKSIEKSTERLKELETKLKSVAGHNKNRIGQLSISRHTRAGSIKWESVPEVAALHKDYLEKFRSKSIEVTQIRLAKEQ